MVRNLDDFMTDRDITNKDLGKLTGLHERTISEIRRGLVKPKFSSLRKISKVLGVSARWLEK